MDNSFDSEIEGNLPAQWGSRTHDVTANGGERAIAVPALERHPARQSGPGTAARPRRADAVALQIVERTLDIAVAATLLVLCMPLMIVIGIMIRLDSPGPALFYQIRLGRDRRRHSDRREPDPKEAAFPERRRRELASRPFRFVKFRTMVVDARERFPELYEYRYTDEQIRTIKFKLDNDPRLTRVGVWLRKSSLDELPNLWNVLAGQITLVGPRPEIPEMSRYYTPAQRRKFHVTPGVTGLAQVCGRGRLTFQETVAYDVEYVDRRSLGLNVWILWRTFVAVVLGRGAF